MIQDHIVHMVATDEFRCDRVRLNADGVQARIDGVWTDLVPEKWAIVEGQLKPPLSPGDMYHEM